MINKTVIAAEIQQQGILPLYYHRDIDVNIGVLRALYAAGIKVLEYAHRGDAALSSFAAMKKVCAVEMRDMRIGIGTIKTHGEAVKYIEAGTDFIVSPGTVTAVGEAANEAGVLWIPGCMTPTDMIQAESLNARMVKLFPSNTLGPGYLDAIKPVFPDLLFMPTGGIAMQEDVIAAWLQRGVFAIGGSKLITQHIMDNRLFEQLTHDTKNALQLYHAIRKSLLT